MPNIDDTNRNAPRGPVAERLLDEVLSGLIEIPALPAWSLEALIDRIEARR